MKYIRKKKVKGKKYYYLQYVLRSVINNEKKHLSHYLGKELPPKKDLKQEMLSFFKEKISPFVIQNINKDIKNYFPPHGINHIIKSRFYYTCLLHKLFKKEFKTFRKLFYLLFVLNSNRAEGSHVAEPDIKNILTKKRVKPKTRIDKEIINSIQAINFAFSPNMKWNQKTIKKIHKILFHDLKPIEAGQYKKQNIIAGNNMTGKIATTTSPDKVSKEMKQLLQTLKTNKKENVYPPILALEFHWRFEAIHPFQDGNGRVGRILLNALLNEKGFMPVIFFNQNHQAYCSAIAKAREGSTKKLAKHFVTQVKKTRKNIKEYKEKKKIKGGSPQVGNWEITKSNIKIYH